MRTCLAALALSLAGVAPAAADDVAVAEGAARVGLIEGWHRADGARVAAIAISMAPGWHTYWRVPGSSGIPPQFDWSGSRNLASVAYEWPRPELFDSFGSRTIGYTGQLVLPVILTPADPGVPLDLAVDAHIGVCSDICIPGTAHLTARLTAEAAPDGADRIEAALAERAMTPAEAGVAKVACTFLPGPDGYELTAEVTFAADPGPGQVTVIELDRPDLWIGPPENRTLGRKVVGRARLAMPGSQTGLVLDRAALRVTVLDARRAVDIHGCPAPT